MPERFQIRNGKSGLWLIKQVGNYPPFMQAGWLAGWQTGKWEIGQTRGQMGRQKKTRTRRVFRINPAI